MSTDEILFRARSISIAAGGRMLVRDWSADLASGAVVGLAGPSGAGKSLLLRVLAGLADADAGQVELGGRTPPDWRWSLFRRRVSLVAQQPAWIAGSLRDNFVRPFSYRVAEGVYREGEAGRLLDAVLLDPTVLDRDPRSLSLGEQRRASLVRHMLVEPDVLLIDEADSGLDADSVRAVANTVRDYVASGARAALWVSHSPDQLGVCSGVLRVGGAAA